MEELLIDDSNTGCTYVWDVEGEIGSALNK
jgi:hypothetical protein